MQSSEKRVSMLEIQAGDDKLKLVTLHDGESTIDALVRVGLSPDHARVLFVSPVDLNL